MQIAIQADNCDFEHPNLIEESLDSVVKIDFDIPTIVSSQSRKILVRGLTESIHQELSKFKWLVTGPVLVDFVWYLSAVDRQETDKVGDLDNISKPIQDALLGPNGILVDDSQIGGLYTYWMSRNESIQGSHLTLTIKFINDTVVYKENLMFVQYYKAICLPLNFDANKMTDLIVAKIIIKARLKLRNVAAKAQKMGTNIDRYFVVSEYDFHRTRLNAFPKEQILTIDQFNSVCKKHGLTIAHLKAFLSKLISNR